jgi:hypothetical protein
MRDVVSLGWDPIGKTSIYHVDYGEGEEVFNDDIVLMQATGLMDKHGQEIYEGDILRAKDGLYVVRWKENYAGFRAFHTASGEAHHMKRRYEVIGNIWENPERGKEASA